MKNILWLLTLILLAGACKKEEVETPSYFGQNCEVSAEGLAFFKPAIFSLTLSDIRSDPSNPDNQSLLIPEERILPFQKVFGIFYDSQSPQRDTVVDVYTINRTHIVEEYGVSINIDTSASWAQQWKNGNFSDTGNNALDQFITGNNLKVKVSSTWLIGWVYVYSESMINPYALEQKLNAFPGIWLTETNYSWANSKKIEILDKSDDAYVVKFAQGFGDCPSGCFFFKYWVFQIHDDCMVTLLDSGTE
jgi:hypothetical protein